MRFPRWPLPPDDAGYPRRFAQLLLLPAAVGGGFALTINALLGPLWAIALICPPALVWCLHALRWSRRQTREIRAQQAEFDRIFRNIHD